MRKSTAFFEVFASALGEDYRFPILEIFVFLQTIGTFVIANWQGAEFVLPNELSAFSLADAVNGFLPITIFTILILKNITYGLGGDLEKGIIQTLFSYPLKRRDILTAKLLSALAVPTFLFIGIQISALFLLAPYTITPYLQAVLVTLAAHISMVFLVAGLAIFLAIRLRQGGMPLIMGFLLYSGLWTVSYGGDALQKIFSFASPIVVVERYYLLKGGIVVFGSWTPVFSEVLFYLIAAYAIVGLVIALGYVYFDRKLGI